MLETVVTPGNIHDSVVFDEVYDKVMEQFPETEVVVTDAAYKTPYDCVICPEYQLLKYSTTNRDGYREYKSAPICANCPTRERCTHSKDCIKTVQRHIWKDYEELAEDARYTPELPGALQEA